MTSSAARLSCLLLPGLLWACGEGPTSAETAGPSVAVGVAALNLPGVTNATYTLTVKNESGETVWTRQADADTFGDGAGGLAIVGPCDADDDPNSDTSATNTVELVLDQLDGTSGALTAGVDYVNPAPAGQPLVRTVVCAANADARVDFSLTIVRAANQGFFDVAVSFSNVFCSAKLDCENDLLFNNGTRDTTVVLALACTGGEGADTHLYMDPITVNCGAPNNATIGPTSPPGNKGAIAPLIYEHAVYHGVEGLTAPGGATLAKAFWNVAIGIDESVLATTDTCTLSTRATASSERFDTGAAPGNTTYPEIVWNVPLKTNGSTGLDCTSYALGAAGGDVSIGYRTDATYPYEFLPDISGGGAGAVAGDSGANSNAPSWVTAPSLGTLLYDGSVSETLLATDPEGGVTYSSPDLPAWLTLSPTGQLTGSTLAQADFGPSTFEVVASDGLHTVSRTFDLFVQHPGACDDIKRANGAETGLTVREIDPPGDGTGVFEVLCDMDSFGGGWTLITAQFENDPAGDWAEGRQGDYDPSLATSAGFALTGTDLVAHDQLGFGTAESTGPGTFSGTLQDYVNFVYDPAAEYSTVSVTGLASTLPLHLDREAGSYHANHNPEDGQFTVPVDWLDTLTIDFDGGRDYTWAFSPNHGTASERGYAYAHGWRGDLADTNAWAMWVRDSTGLDAPPPAPPTDCDGYTGLTGTSVQVIDPTGSDPLTVMCDFDYQTGGWTLVAAMFEGDQTSATGFHWQEGRDAGYSPSLRFQNTFTLTGTDMPTHGEVAFGRTRGGAGGAISVNDKVDYVEFTYDPVANYDNVLVAGKDSAATYHIDRNTASFHDWHDPEDIVNSGPAWNNTLTFDIVGGQATWAFAPQNGTLANRGYAYEGFTTATDDTYAWTVWVRPCTPARCP